MAHSKKTFRLDKDWNIVTDGGAFMLLSGNEATAQNVANEIKLFKNDAWIAKDEGNSWFDIQLGKPIRRLATSDALRKSAKKVEQVESVQSIQITDLDFDNRVLHAEMIVRSEGEEFALHI